MKRYSLTRKAWIGIVSITLMALLVFWLRIARQPDQSSVPEPMIGKADVRVEGMELSETDGEDLEWNLKAEKAELYEKEGVAYLKNITLAYSVENGKKIVLTGDRGRINLSEKRVFLEGNVKASSYEIQLKTEALSWLREERMLMTEEPVWLRNENVEITGRGMVADMDLWKIKLKEEVKTTIY
ncbi:MAG: LPS export ABC transporter periplasmic protein LptC [bacterium]